VLLVFEHLLTQLVTLLLDCFVLLLQFLVIAITQLTTQILLNLICKMLVQIFSHLQLLLYYLQLILKRFINIFVFLVTRFITT